MANVLTGTGALDRRRAEYARAVVGCLYTVDGAATLDPINLTGFQSAAITVDATNAGAFSVNFFHSLNGTDPLNDLNSGTPTTASDLLQFNLPLSWVIVVVNSLASGTLLIDVKAA